LSNKHCRRTPPLESFALSAIPQTHLLSVLCGFAPWREICRLENRRFTRRRKAQSLAKINWAL
jgi:hypothetical protein